MLPSHVHLTFGQPGAPGPLVGPGVSHVVVRARVTRLCRDLSHGETRGSGRQIVARVQIIACPGRSWCGLHAGIVKLTFDNLGDQGVTLVSLLGRLPSVSR